MSKTTCSEEFDDVHKVLLDGISANMVSLLHTGKHVAINAAYTTILCNLVFYYIYELFTLQYDITTYSRFRKAV